MVCTYTRRLFASSHTHVHTHTRTQFPGFHVGFVQLATLGRDVSYRCGGVQLRPGGPQQPPTNLLPPAAPSARRGTQLHKPQTSFSLCMCCDSITYMYCLHTIRVFCLQKSNAEHPIYPSTIVNTTPTSPSLPPAHLHPSHPHPPSPCIEFPLPHSRLEPGEGVGASLVLQGQGGRYSEEEPWNLVFYYEPALITANSRIRYSASVASFPVQAWERG